MQQEHAAPLRARIAGDDDRCVSSSAYSTGRNSAAPAKNVPALSRAAPLPSSPSLPAPTGGPYQSSRVLAPAAPLATLPPSASAPHTAPDVSTENAAGATAPPGSLPARPVPIPARFPDDTSSAGHPGFPIVAWPPALAGRAAPPAVADPFLCATSPSLANSRLQAYPLLKASGRCRNRRARQPAKHSIA
jgi:hypothetical protein